MLHRDSTGKSTASLPKKYRTPVDYSKLKMLNEYSVLFVWVDEEEDEFEHSSGIVIARTLAKDRERWGRIVAKHPTSEVTVGDYLVPNKVHEPFGTVINGLEHWMTYDKDITVVSSDFSVTQTLTGDVKCIELANPEKDNSV